MTEQELIEALAEALQRALAPHVPWSAANQLARANRYAATSACLVYLRAHADEVCRLLGGVGPQKLTALAHHLSAAGKGNTVEGHVLLALDALRGNEDE